MKLLDFEKACLKLKSQNPSFKYEFNKSLTEKEIKIFENQLKINIPVKVKEFYLQFNGLKTHNPKLEILSMEKWLVNESNQIQFAIFNESNTACFDITKINSAGEWTIINPDIDKEITLTISSFWSNKIWHWLKFKREIWNNVTY